MATKTVEEQKTCSLPTTDNTGADCQSFKLVIVGDSKVGKTAFMKRLLTGRFDRKYEPTNGVEISNLHFNTNCGKIQFHCWDTAGDDNLGGLRDGYYINGHCAIIMFDVSESLTYSHVSRWYQDVCRVCGKIPVVLCGNKTETRNKKVKAKQVLFHRKNNLQYYEISSKNKYNLERPLLYLARRLFGNSSLHFVQEPAPLVAPVLQVDRVVQEHMERSFLRLL